MSTGKYISPSGTPCIENAPAGWSRPFAAVEGSVGAFMIARFTLSFVKK